MNAFEPGLHVHIAGIGGAGMSGLALMLHEMGLHVSGCDSAPTSIVEALAEAGIDVEHGHSGQHLLGVDIFLWSPALPVSSEEYQTASSSGIRMMKRAEVFGALGATQNVVGLTGTHGKTTATSMMAHVLHAAGLDYSRLLGAPVLGLGPNGHYGSDGLVLEVDESYGTFSLLHPFALGVMNVEPDHLDYYGTFENLLQEFADIIRRTSGPVVIWHPDEGARRAAALSDTEVVLVGPNCTYDVSEVAIDKRHSNFRIEGPGLDETINLRVTGAHNIANASVVAALASQIGIASESIRRGLEAFEGAPRRYQFLGTWHGADVYEDYAHLPGEISATLEAGRASGYEHITVVFQPHRVTRTLNVGTDFGPALDLADMVLVTDIYTAGEDNPLGVTGELVANAVSVPVHYVPNLADIATVLRSTATATNAVFFLGAGDIARASYELLSEDSDEF